MEQMFSNPFWHALKTEHAAMALGSAAALRYPADMIPFAALKDNSKETLEALLALLSPGEIIYAIGDSLPQIEGLLRTKEIQAWQMHFPAEAGAWQALHPQADAEVTPLGELDAPSMVALTDVAFPGFFRRRTYLLGGYVGIRVEGHLVAMAGHRIAVPGYREISAVCTHPDHTGRGYAAILIRHLLSAHAAAGLRSFLHVTASNHRAIQLYERLGFVKAQSILINQFQKA